MSKDLVKLNVKDPLLSIQVMTSHRKDTIRKCLDSITHLRETVPSELVMVDTGCDEEMRSIIEEYTDHIIKFEWCNDFAKARNAGLNECKGKWFMFMDDDEWFEDTKDLENIFISGKYKTLKAIFYVQRNYTDRTGLRFSDDPVSRIFEKTPELKFVGRIHEYLDPFEGVYTKVGSYVHHYGYVFDSDKEKYEHSLRNLSLLKEVLKEDRGQIRWWLQTAQEYNAIQEFDNMAQLCEEGLTVFTKDKTGDDKFLWRDIAGLYMGIIQSDIRTYKYEQAIKDGERALADERLRPMAVAQVHVDMARAYVELKRYDEMREACLAYFEEYERMHDKEGEILEQTCFMVDETFTQKFYELMCWLMIVYAMDKDDIPLLKEYFEKIDWSKPSLFVYNMQTVLDVLKCIARNEYDPWFIHAATNIVTRSDYIDPACRLMNDLENKEDLTEFNRLVRIMSHISVSSFYMDYMKVLSLHVEGSRHISNDELYDIVKLTITEMVDILSLKEEYWEILKERDIDIAGLFKGMPYDRWVLCVDTFCSDNGVAELSYMSDLIDGISPIDEENRDIRFDYYDMRSVEAALNKGIGRENYHDFKDLMKTFVSKELGFHKKLYRPEVFEDLPEVLPEDCRVALLLDKGFVAENADDYKTALETYKSAIGIRHYMNDPIQAYSHYYADKVKGALPQQEEVFDIDEKTQLEWQIKLKIRELEQMGHAEEAKKIREQLDEILKTS